MCQNHHSLILQNSRGSLSYAEKLSHRQVSLQAPTWQLKRFKIQSFLEIWITWRKQSHLKVHLVAFGQITWPSLAVWVCSICYGTVIFPWSEHPCWFKNWGSEFVLNLGNNSWMNRSNVQYNTDYIPADNFQVEIQSLKWTWNNRYKQPTHQQKHSLLNQIQNSFTQDIYMFFGPKNHQICARLSSIP